MGIPAAMHIMQKGHHIHHNRVIVVMIHGCEVVSDAAAGHCCKMLQVVGNSTTLVSQQSIHESRVLYAVISMRHQ